MTCSRCQGVERRFDERLARRNLRRYLERGPSRTTRMLIEAVRDAEGEIEGRTFLDVGGGIGTIQHELIEAGAAGGTSAEASPAFLRVCREEAEARGYADRVRYVEGDFVEVKHLVEPADIVTLDRVVCCYEDMPALVDASASRARGVYALVYPRDKLRMKVAIGLINLFHALRRHPFRAFVHPEAEIEARAEARGLRKRSHVRTFLWQVVTFTRPEARA